jgi:hypothetical protein
MIVHISELGFFKQLTFNYTVRFPKVHLLGGFYPQELN